jgi:hypothetical protein
MAAKSISKSTTLSKVADDSKQDLAILRPSGTPPQSTFSPHKIVSTLLVIPVLVWVLETCEDIKSEGLPLVSI